MGVAFANLGASADPDFASNADAASYASAAWTPPVEGAIVLFVTSRNTAGNHGPPTVTGNSLTWTQIATVTFEVNRRRLTLFAAPAAGATNGATTIDFGVNTQEHCVASFAQVTGVNLTGSIDDIFIQAVTTSGGGPTATIAMGEAQNLGSRAMACFVVSGPLAVTPRAGWTEFDELSASTPTASLETQVRTDAFEETASATWAVAFENFYAGIAVELRVLLSNIIVNTHYRNALTNVRERTFFANAHDRTVIINTKDRLFANTSAIRAFNIVDELGNQIVDELGNNIVAHMEVTTNAQVATANQKTTLVNVKEPL